MTAHRAIACYYYEPVKLPVLSAAVLPAARLGRERGLRAYVDRHWLHGPHLALHLQGEERLLDAVAGEVTLSLREHLRVAPSRSASTAAELLESSLVNGRAELVPGPYEPIHPDNTVLVSTPGDEIAGLIGGPAALDCRVALLERGVVVLDQLDPTDTASGGQRVQLALTAMAAHAASYPLGLAGGYVSFLSHVEDFLYRNDPNGRARASFDQVFERNRAGITATVGAPGAAWAGWSRDAMDLCTAAYRRGELPLLPGDDYADRAGALADDATALQWSPQRTGFSEFHNRLAGIDFIDGVHDSFGPYRFATNVLYRLLVVCDVTPAERYLAAHLLARAVQEMRGRTWQQDFATLSTGVS